MKAKWFDEVADLVQSDAYGSWLERLEDARARQRRLRDRHEEVLTQVNLLDFRAELAHRKAIDTLERANQLEDESIELSNESAAIENDSFEAVSRFEEKRQRCTKLWSALGALEHDLEAATQAGADSRKIARQIEERKKEYEREDALKQRFWAQVEDLWLRSIDRGLALHEKRSKARLVRLEAERYFQRQEDETQQADTLREEGERLASQRETCRAEVAEICGEARDAFACLLHEDFLYWPAREDNNLVYVTPLVRDEEHYAVALCPRAVYRCPHERGLDELVELELESPANDTPDASGASTGEDAPSSDSTAEEAVPHDASSEGGASEGGSSAEPASEGPSSEAATSEGGASGDGASGDGASEDGASEDGSSEEPASEGPSSEAATSEDGASEGGASAEPASEAPSSEAASSEGAGPPVPADGVPAEAGSTPKEAGPAREPRSNREDKRGRRKGKRHRRAPLEVRVDLHFEDRKLTTSTQNIAAGGVSFETEERCDVGEGLEAHCYVPLPDSFEPMKIRAEVVWVEAQGDAWKTGIAFREFQGEDEERLKRWLLERIRAERAPVA